jgi:hypothetical protein
MDRIGHSINDRERQWLVESCRKAKTKEKWLQSIASFAQEIEMSASLARLQNRYDQYESRMKTAADLYSFVKQHTKQATLKKRMQLAEDEILRRL